MKNRIEEQVLSLINEIDESLSDPENFKKNREYWNKPRQRIHPPGSTWKTKSGKTATKDSAGKVTYSVNSPASNYDALKKDRRKKPEGWKSASDASYRTDTKTNESAPEGKGWEKTVKGMKKHKDISNPFALAHWMKKKGYKPKTEVADPDPNSSNPDGTKATPEELEKRARAHDAAADVALPSSKAQMKHKQTATNLRNRESKARNKHSSYDRQAQDDKDAMDGTSPSPKYYDS